MSMSDRRVLTRQSSNLSSFSLNPQLVITWVRCCARAESGWRRWGVDGEGECGGRVGMPCKVESSSRHSTLEVDRISHQFLVADNGSSSLVCDELGARGYKGAAPVLYRCEILLFWYVGRPGKGPSGNTSGTFCDDRVQLAVALSLTVSSQPTSKQDDAVVLVPWPLGPLGLYVVVRVVLFYLLVAVLIVIVIGAVCLLLLFAQFAGRLLQSLCRGWPKLLAVIAYRHRSIALCMVFRLSMPTNTLINPGSGIPPTYLSILSISTENILSTQQCLVPGNVVGKLPQSCRCLPLVIHTSLPYATSLIDCPRNNVRRDGPWFRAIAIPIRVQWANLTRVPTVQLLMRKHGFPSSQKPLGQVDPPPFVP
ncbi:hypothetical protein Tco_0496979 [Tanacetum coccineum]